MSKHFFRWRKKKGKNLEKKFFFNDLILTEKDQRPLLANETELYDCSMEGAQKSIPVCLRW